MTNGWHGNDFFVISYRPNIFKSKTYLKFESSDKSNFTLEFFDNSDYASIFQYKEEKKKARQLIEKARLSGCLNDQDLDIRFEKISPQFDWKYSKISPQFVTSVKLHEKSKCKNE